MPDNELTVQQMIDALESAQEWVTRAANTLEAGGRDRVIAGSGTDTITGWHVIATMNFVHQLAGAVRAGLEVMDNRDEVVHTKDTTTGAVIVGPLGQKLQCDGPVPIAGLTCAIDLGPIARRSLCGGLVDLVCGTEDLP